MDKTTLVKTLARRLNVTQKDIGIIVEELIKIFNESLSRRETFKIQEMFSIKIKPCKPFRWRHPVTGVMHEGKPYYKVIFSLNEKLQNKIDKMKVTIEDLEDIGIDPLSID